MSETQSSPQATEWPQGDLFLAGKSTDHIWAMCDGVKPAIIGLRLDCGDCGAVYFTPSQAQDTVDTLNAMIMQWEEFQEKEKEKNV